MLNRIKFHKNIIHSYIVYRFYSHHTHTHTHIIGLIIYFIIKYIWRNDLMTK